MDDARHLCRALAVRLHTGADPGRLGARLARATAGHPHAGTRLWVEDVAQGPDSPAAAARRVRELDRPVNPETGPGLRAVLLRYQDGTGDLIMVVHRAVFPDPRALVEALLAGPEAHQALPVQPPEHALRLREGLARLGRAPAPDWGLGTPGAGTAGCVEFTLPMPDGGGEGDVLVRPAAALGLVLARCTGRTGIALGGGPEPAMTFTADGAATARDYLAGVRAAVAAQHTPQEGPSDPAPDPPAAEQFEAEPFAAVVTTASPGVLTDGEPKAEIREERPFLAPTHPLTFHVTAEGPAGSALTGRCWFRHDAFDGRVAQWLVDMLTTAHRELAAADPHTAVGSLALFDAEQHRRLAVLGGLGRRPAARADARVPGRIDLTVGEWAVRTPDAPAVTSGDETLTYRQLDARAERAARALRARGVGAGDRVGVSLGRTQGLVVVLLAVLKSGAAYVPMDPAYPADRLAFTAEDAGLAAVVTEAADFPAPDGVPVLPPDALLDGGRSAESGRLDSGRAEPGDAGSGRARPGDAALDPPDPDAAAYVIFTSGSTGRPKGVVVSHRGVGSLLAATRDDFGLSERDVWTLFHSSAFDFSVWEIWGCLMTGGRLVVVDYWATRDAERFARLLADEQVTVLSQTPSAFSQLMAVDREEPVTGSVRLVVFGGEPLDTRPLRHWLDRHPERACRLVNMFGITETTVHVTAQTVTRAEALAGSRSVGAPIPGWHVYVLDGEGRPLPPGVAGEIHVGGAGVAGEYLGRPELTVRRFVPDPFAPGPMYRSGDRGRLRPDGRLEHLGRLDSQVKLRGFRIELDEIRALLLEAPGVAAAAVVLHQDPADPAGARLDGYVVLDSGAGTGGTEDVRAHAARFLPEHMVPSTLTALPALPLTPNGKVDTGRLPEPLLSTANGAEADGEEAAAGGAGGADEGPGGPESRLRAVWEQVFGFRVGPDDDFFALGGNSLLSVRLNAAMRSAGLPAVPLSQIYLSRTVRALAARIAEEEEPG